MKTIKQIADELQVSKQAVYKRVKGRLHTEVLPYAHTVNGTMYLEEQGETLIKSDFLQDTASEGAHTGSHTEQPMDAAVIRLLQDTVDTLKQQLEAKDQQITELIAALATAQENLRGAQALHGGTMQKQLTTGKQRLRERLSRIFGKETQTL